MVPFRAQQDCVPDHKRDGNSELLAVTSDLDCHWYIISERLGMGVASSGQLDGAERKETKREGKEERGGGGIKVELMAMLKKTDLCYKLRKMDFRELIITCLNFFGIKTNRAKEDEGNVCRKKIKDHVSMSRPSKSSAAA